MNLNASPPLTISVCIKFTRWYNFGALLLIPLCYPYELIRIIVI